MSEGHQIYVFALSTFLFLGQGCGLPNSSESSGGGSQTPESSIQTGMTRSCVRAVLARFGARTYPSERIGLSTIVLGATESNVEWYILPDQTLLELVTCRFPDGEWILHGISLGQTGAEYPGKERWIEDAQNVDTVDLARHTAMQNGR